MDDDNLMDVNFTDLDLNQEPTDPPLDTVERFGSLLNNLETTHGRIEERIRQLEAVMARSGQRQRWRQARNFMESSHFSGEMMVNVSNARVALDGNNNMATVERTAERGKGLKRDSSHLVAKALEMDSEVNKVDKEGGSFYDCNICLEIATDPVLTCCGHLFCWACFYQVSHVDSTSKECPVCKGEVSDSTVIPIYGNGGGDRVHVTETGLKIPPRPKAQRVESIRQRRLTQGLSHVPVAEALRRIRISIGAAGDQSPQQEGGPGIAGYDAESREGQNVETAAGPRTRNHHYSRVLSESAASLSSLSSLTSALSNAERLVEDLETVISSRMLIRADARAPSIDVNPFTRYSSFIHSSSNRPPDSAADLHAALPVSSSSQLFDVSGSGLRVRALRTSSEINMPVVPSASSPQRRRSTMSRISDVDNRDARESRRRRLN